MNVSVAKVMRQVGAAINNTFHFRHIGPKVISRKGVCKEGFAQINAPVGGECTTVDDITRPSFQAWPSHAFASAALG